MTSLVHKELAGGIATITLDSPPNRNALSVRLLGDLERRLNWALTEPDVRVIVLTGAGPVFCSGADLKEQRV
ncbi:MAG TPA: enoyl-CoA hydratase/isomerase family protein, partial [Nonomuraea sp.]|nr:enoyl-CoA hydratase/isomerase family protein [Nonomuraea sp.]